MEKLYIGKTARIAEVLFSQLPKLQNGSDAKDRRYLLTGPPGTGKTDLAERLAAQLTGESFESVHNGKAINVEAINGQSCSIEMVRAWQEAGRYGTLFGNGVRVQLVDEIDAASPAACNELRTYLDRLPKHVIFLATTNKNVEELQEQLQSRFKVHYFSKVPAEQIEAWLKQKFPTLHPSSVVSIAKKAKGNVRSAEMDALAETEI